MPIDHVIRNLTPSNKAYLIEGIVNSLCPSNTVWGQIWTNIGSGNGLLPDRTQPLYKPMLTYYEMRPVVLTFKLYHQECPRNESVICVWKLPF